MKILVSVFNNLLTDQRVEKICKTLYDGGYEIELIGNNWGGEPQMQRSYSFYRIPLKAKKLRFAYLEYNYKLYLELKKRISKDTILLANDLDTLLPNYLISKKYRLPLVYDSHEIFTEMPSVRGRFVQKIWRKLEKTIYPKLKYKMVANESYAHWFLKTYQKGKPLVIENYPRKYTPLFIDNTPQNFPKIIIYQGAINPSRGLDKIIPIMGSLENTEFWIVGRGPKLKEYQELASRFKLENKIKFLGSLTPEELREITPKADVGISIEENNGLSYYYTLPNKISDYIQARVPVVVSDFPEMSKIVNEFHVGEIINNHSEAELIGKLQTVINNGKDYYEKNLEQASEVLCWENNEKRLISFYNDIVKAEFDKK